MRRLVACVSLLAVATAARAELRLPDAAFVTPPPCEIEPFAEAGLTQQIAAHTRNCGGRLYDIGVDPPPATDARPTLLRARASRVASERFGAMLATLKLGWSGASEAAHDWRLRTGEAVMAASGLVQLQPRFALRAQLGLDAANASRNRTRLAGLWAPGERHFMYAEWARQGGEERIETHAFGLRWWLVPQRVAFDVAARWLPGEPGTRQPSLALVLPGLGR